MRILNQVGYATGLGADRWIGGGYKDAFESMGHEFFWYVVAHDDFAARIAEVQPDIMIIAQDMLRAKNRMAIAEARARGTKVVLRVDSFFDADPEVAQSLRDYDLADIYFGEVEDPHMDRFKEVTKKPYVIIANAAYRTQRPGVPMQKYKADIVFLGAMLPKKKEMFRTLLFPLMKRYQVKVYGPGWTIKDNAMRIAARLAREAGLMKLNDKISRARISVPPDEEGSLYSSAKICINLHERGPEANVILNERTFKIPACGGFEVCDFVPALRRYFTESEMAMATPPFNGGSWEQDWFKKIDYYMTHEMERERMQERGTARALRDHTYVNRVHQIFELLGIRTA